MRHAIIMLSQHANPGPKNGIISLYVHLPTVLGVTMRTMRTIVAERVLVNALTNT